MHRRSEHVILAMALLTAVASPSAWAESKQVFGIHSWDWGAHIDVMSNRTGWCVEANVTAQDTVDVNRHKWASGEGFTVLQRLDWKWEQTIPLATAEQDQFAAQCGAWANAVKGYTRHYSIGNEVEFFDVTATIYAACFQKVRSAIKAVQPDAIVIIGHMNSSQRQYDTMLLLGPDGYDGVTAHTGSSVPVHLFDYLDQAGARPGVGVYITEFGWVAGTNPSAMSVMTSFAQSISQWNAANERQVFCAAWYLYPGFLGATFSLQTSPLDNAAFENVTAQGIAINSLQNNPVNITDLVADVPDAGNAIGLSWNTNVPAHRQLWWTKEGTWSWNNEKFTDRTTAMSASHQYTITSLLPSTTYEVMPNCTRYDYADAGGRRFRVTTGPWPSTALQVPAATLSMRVSWHTSWGSDSRVEYGPTAALGLQVIDPAIVNDHAVTLGGLTPGNYHYRIISAEPQMDPQVGRMLVRSPLRTFTVLPQAPGDYEGDGDVDTDDAAWFAACYSGPSGQAGFIMPNQPCLDAFDGDKDGDIDCTDHVRFTQLWTGPPTCPPAFITCESDCNNDGVLDSCEVAQGLKADCDGNGQPDDCQPDSDGDGVPNVCDLCPDTMPGSYVDEDGCPTFLKADQDRDGDVDQEDFGLFQACYTGEGIGVTDPACVKARLDGDDDVDMGDFARFVACFRGPNVPADPACEN